MTSVMTQAEFAAHRGVSKAAVTGWKKRQLLVMIADPGTGKPMVDVRRSTALVEAMIDPARGRPSRGAVDGTVPEPVDMPVEEIGGPLQRSLSIVRSELVDEQLVGQRLKNAKAAGELGVQSELERRATESGRMFRERLNAMHRALAERIAAERDPRVVLSLLEAEADAMLHDLADAIAAGLLAADDDDGDLEVEEAAVAEAA